MTETNVPSMMDRRHLTLWERAATLLSWTIAGAIFLSVGWTAAAPDDPHGPVSLLARSHPAFSAIQLAALAAVTAGIATVLVGRYLPDVGVLATAIGIGVLSIQGGTSAYFLVSGTVAGAVTAPVLSARLAAESAIWFLVLMVVVVLSGIIGRWVLPSAERASSTGRPAEPVPVPGIAPAAADLPVIGRIVRGSGHVTSTPLFEGLKHTAIATVLALVAYQLLSSGLHSRVIRHGQACFVVAASIWLATRFAFQFAPVRTSLWALLSVGITAIVAYLWASLRPGPSSLPPAIPGSHFLRVLPIQFVFVGAAAAIMAVWHAEIGTETHSPAEESPRAAPTRQRR